MSTRQTPLAMASSVAARVRGRPPKPVAVNPLQERMLRGLIAAGGALAYRQVFRATTGRGWDDLSSLDRVRVGVSMRGLEKRRMLDMSRQWGGALGYGKPGLVRVTELGRTAVL